ncbi:MAG TPA: RNA polymerase factor sigma-54 [Rhabdochlamydiaceae bacterium]|nr:RNA polymerase factor sigma-54 [Rhabdochlamydiaceae bacterium]
MGMHIRPQQAPLFSLAMRQAIEVLQMPLQELSQWLKLQIEQNPALECKDEIKTELPSRTAANYENFIRPPSLFEFLMQQARNCFRGMELDIAEWIIGNLDERGFFVCPQTTKYSKEDLTLVLQTVQSFDPPGIAALNLKESLLIQLIRKGKKESLSYKIVESYFDDLLHHRISNMAKKMRCSCRQIKELIHRDLFPLNLQPAAGFNTAPTLWAIPDVFIENREGSWNIEMNHQELPSLELSLNFLKHFHSSHLSEEEKATMRRCLTSAKWLIRIVGRRKQTLLQIIDFILKKQVAFFKGEQSQFIPCSLDEIAQFLGLHKSTISRAIYEKSLCCPQGVFPLKRFISASTVQHSNHYAKELLTKFIKTENKRRPLSDQELSEKLRAENIPCSRRTIAKYRRFLNIPASSYRKL